MTRPEKDRFWEKVQQGSPDECWPWTAATQKGYGVFMRADRKSRKAHRVAWEYAHGVLPDGVPLDHLCHTNDASCTKGDQCLHRRCCNPDHLEPVTHQENSRRAGSRRVRTHCPAGHSYEKYGRNQGGYPACRICDAVKHHQRTAKRREEQGLPPKVVPAKWKYDEFPREDT